MSDITPPPAPDASKRLNAPPPSGVPLNVPAPTPPKLEEVKAVVTPEVEKTKETNNSPGSTSISISSATQPSEGNGGFKAFVEKRFRGIALGLSIMTLFLYVIPFIGVLFSGYSLYFAIRGEQKAQGKKKMLIWAIVLSSLGTLSSLGMTMGFLGYVSK